MPERDPRPHDDGPDFANAGTGIAASSDQLIDETEFDEVVDPDVDLHDPQQQRETRSHTWGLALVTAAGGILGAWSRYGLGLALPHDSGAFPWSTVIINSTGCLLIGALMVILLELTSPHRLVRPFLGVGVLGGYTTFSTFAVDAERLVLDHRPLIALLYVVTTLIACGAAVWVATTATLSIGRVVVAARTRQRKRKRRNTR